MAFALRSGGVEILSSHDGGRVEDAGEGEKSGLSQGEELRSVALQILGLFFIFTGAMVLLVFEGRKSVDTV